MEVLMEVIDRVAVVFSVWMVKVGVAVEVGMWSGLESEVCLSRGRHCLVSSSVEEMELCGSMCVCVL